MEAWRQGLLVARTGEVSNNKMKRAGGGCILLGEPGLPGVDGEGMEEKLGLVQIGMEKDCKSHVFPHLHE